MMSEGFPNAAKNALKFPCMHISSGSALSKIDKQEVFISKVFRALYPNGPCLSSNQPTNPNPPTSTHATKKRKTLLFKYMPQGRISNLQIYNVLRKNVVS
eukprot:TRINITY_DN19812_c0_g1_i1.p1 TRINITY_DN19812_c0_g1~~TRINITY_DN19812_c0_g1_i1.p1  ORF type:complete len:100 (+),score=5.33 TRINITY_DN19812_c0_g1_i1:1167-1466(+)